MAYSHIYMSVFPVLRGLSVSALSTITCLSISSCLSPWLVCLCPVYHYMSVYLFLPISVACLSLPCLPLHVCLSLLAYLRGLSVSALSTITCLSISSCLSPWLVCLCPVYHYMSVYLFLPISVACLSLPCLPLHVCLSLLVYLLAILSLIVLQLAML